MKKYLLSLLLLGCSNSETINDVKYIFVDEDIGYNDALSTLFKSCSNANGKKCVVAIMKKGAITPLTYPINQWQADQVLMFYVYDPDREGKFWSRDNCKAFKEAHNCFSADYLSEAFQPYIE